MPERLILSDVVRNAGVALANRTILRRPKRMDYVVLRLSGSLPERAPRPRPRFPLSLLPWPPSLPSLESLCDALDRLTADPRIAGVILVISGLSAPPARLTSLREAIARFQDAGKRAIAYVTELDLWSYYLACACSQVIAPESATFQATGLWSEALFLKDTLALAGIEADFEAIAEYKVSPDTFRRSQMTEPHREMLESLLDSIYNHVTSAIAKGRHITTEQIRRQLDTAPFAASRACEEGLLDAVCYEDELATYLGSEGSPITAVTWEQASRRLLRLRRCRSRKHIGLISVEGLIVSGASRHPPVPLPLPMPLTLQQAGSDTLIQQLRAAARDRRVAAVVLHVDSPGGSALASDLIGREVTNLSRSKPVVVFMGPRAASGGYYVSTPAHAIIAGPLTLTGSIGIWGGKIVTQGLYDRLHAKREIIARGKAAGLYSDAAPFTDEERMRIRAEIGAGYARFKARVAQGRRMTEEQVEALARGRVWAGEQALERGLVDALGDMQAAVHKARELAGSDPRRFTPLIAVPAPRRSILPQPGTGSADWLAGLTALLREGVWAMAPWEIRLHG